MQNFGLEALGGGAGLRSEHFQEILETKPDFKWFEIINENIMGIGGWIKEAFEEIRKDYRIIPHGVCMSIGSTDPLDMTFLKKMRDFLDHINAPWNSDHLCFTMVDHTNLNELIPIPFSIESANNVIERVKIVQDILGRPFLLENVTRYITISEREMSEAEFISTIAEKANCGILLDITNAYLNSKFHNFDALEFIKSLPIERIGQMHLAGWDDEDGQVLDTHDAPVPPEVWDLFKKTIEITGPSSVLVEWDNHLPSLDRLLQETKMADEIIAKHTSNEKMRAGACR